MPDDYPVLDDASMRALVDDYEAQEKLPSLDDDKDLPPVPLPPEANHSMELPIIDETPPFEDGFLQQTPRTVGFSAPKEELQEKKIVEPSFPVETVEEPKTVPINKGDVQELALLENVFDKRITDRDVEREMAVETRNDSGRLLDKEDVEVKTELNDQEILTISKLRFVADRYEIPVLRDFTDNLMTLKISRHRKGRTEFIQGLHADERRETPNEGFFSKIFGGRN